jgi:hypothetical protein
MVEAGGVGILSLTDNAQLIDFIKREKLEKQHIRLSEVHGGYTESSAKWFRGRTSGPFIGTVYTNCMCDTESHSVQSSISAPCGVVKKFGEGIW